VARAIVERLQQANWTIERGPPAEKGGTPLNSHGSRDDEHTKEMSKNTGSAIFSPAWSWRQLSSSLAAEISRQRSSLSLARRAGEVLPRAKPKEAAGLNRSTSSIKNEFATSAARNAARTSPSQIAIACSTATSKESGAFDGGADLTFLVALPELNTQIDFGATYIQYETTFLVSGNSAVHGLTDIDRPGVRVIAPNPSVIATTISQTFKNVKLIGVPIATNSAQRVVEMLKHGEADAYSNLTHLLSLTQLQLPDWRILPGSYMTPVFSIGYPKDRQSGATYANSFITEMKKNGFIQRSIEQANVKGATVPN
jgi:hypothetical protein